VNYSTSCGVYQKISNLTPAAVYDIVININPNPLDSTGRLFIYKFQYPFYTGLSLVGVFDVGLSQTAQVTAQFTAQSFSQGILIYYKNTGTSSLKLVIKDISVSQTIVAPSGVYADLQDGQVICDLYEEEDIPLTLSVDDFKNVAQKIQSYSKDFNLPATKRNNRIFNNMFEITRADDGLIFNPYARTQCVLKQDGFILFEGYLRMIDVKDKEGEISYNVNLYSDVIALADVLKDRTFADLDLSELQSDYTYANIQNSWDGNLELDNALTDPNEFAGPIGSPTTSVMKYPFIDWNHQFFLDTNGNPEMPNLNSAFRPCISIKYLISKIFAQAGFNWTSNFFDSTIATGGAFDFDKLYMDFNWGNDENPTDIQSFGIGRIKRSETFANNYATTSWTPIKVAFENYSESQGYDIATGIFTVPAGQTHTTFVINYSVRFLFLKYDSPATLSLRWVHLAGGVAQPPIDLDAGNTVIGSAEAYADIDDSGSGTLGAINIIHGGHYASAPTIEIVDNPSNAAGSGATATCTIDGAGRVNAITITDGGSGYESSKSPFVMFNSIGVYPATYVYSGNLSVTLNAGDTLQLQMISDTADAVLQDHRKNPETFWTIYPTNTAYINVQSNVDNMADSTLLNVLRGEVGQWDFLKGIMTMFNLVSMVDDTNKNNILIEPYSDVFIKNTNSLDQNNMTLASRSIEHDWTNKVDVSEMELKPLTDLNKNTIFKFVEDDDDYCFNAYKMATSGGLYGSKEIDATTSTNGLPTILEGEEEIIAEPFAATVVKPLQDFFPDFIIPSIYSVDDSGASEGFDNSPRILYDNGVQTLTSCTYTVPAQNNGAAVTNENEFLQFSHLSSIPINPQTTEDFNFESQQLIQPLDENGMPTNNLYSRYWRPYFNELYSADTRIMTLKVNLSPSDIATFKFYDTVMIKNRSFRVNKIEYKPNSLAKVEFILIP
jgi:hypothetical protein